MISYVFEQAVKDWKKLAREAKEERHLHELAWGRAFAASEKQTERAQKAEADVATIVTRTKADNAEVEERAAYFEVVWLLNEVRNNQETP